MEQEQQEVTEAELMEMLRYLRKRAMWNTIYRISLDVFNYVMAFGAGFVVCKYW